MLTLAAVIAIVASIVGVRAWMVASTSGADETARSRGVPSLQVLRELPTPGPVTAMRWSSEGALLATADYPPSRGPIGIQSPFGKSITIWDADGRSIRTLTRPQAFFTVGDGFAFVGSDRQIAAPPLFSSNSLGFSIIDVGSGEIVHEVPGPAGGGSRYVNRAKLLVASPEQSILAVAFPGAEPVALYSTQEWTKIADLPTGTVKSNLPPTAMAFSNDGKLLAVGRSKFAIIYDVQSREIVKAIEVPLDGAFNRGIAFSRDGSMIAVATGTVRVLSIADATLIATYSDAHFNISSLAWGEQFIVFLTGHLQLRVWNPLRPGNEAKVIELGSLATELSLSPDKRKLAVNLGDQVSIFGTAP